MSNMRSSGVKERIHRRMEENKLDIFNFPRTPKNILWYLTHKYLYNDLGIYRLDIWDHLLKKYINDPRFTSLDTNEKKTSARGNITNQIWSADESMSVTTFVKAALIAGVKQINFTVEWETDKDKYRGYLKFPLNEEVVVTSQDVKELSQKEEIMDKISSILDNPDKLELRNKLLNLIENEEVDQ